MSTNMLVDESATELLTFGDAWERGNQLPLSNPGPPSARRDLQRVSDRRENGSANTSRPESVLSGCWPLPRFARRDIFTAYRNGVSLFRNQVGHGIAERVPNLVT
jgi:hypothetical protein